MLVLIAESVLLAMVVVVAGAFLARYADALGEKTGMGRSLAGMILLAFATSLPELAVDCSAALIPAPDLAVGDLLGSSLFNLLILAGLDLVYRSGEPMLSRGSAAHALSANSTILLTSIVLLAILLRDPWAVWRIGAGSLAVAVVYLACLRLIFFDQRYQQRREAASRPARTSLAAAMSLRRAVTGYLIATAAIFATAPFLADRADQLAVATGLGETFVGTLLLALTTSLPEVSTTRQAVKMGAPEMAIGNIFGSNSVNMLILAPVDLFYAGNLLADVEPGHAVTATAVILITAVTTLGLLSRAERRFWIVEYDAAVIILMILAAFGLIYWVGVAS